MPPHAYQTSEESDMIIYPSCFKIFQKVPFGAGLTLFLTRNSGTRFYRNFPVFAKRSALLTSIHMYKIKKTNEDISRKSRKTPILISQEIRLCQFLSSTVLYLYAKIQKDLMMFFKKNSGLTNDSQSIGPTS